MDNFFYWIYKSSRKNKWIFILIILSVLVAGGLSLSRLRFEEDISKVIPKDQQISDIEELLNSSRFGSLLTLHLYQNDTLQARPNHLIAVAESLRDSLLPLTPRLIKSITLDYPDTLVAAYYDHFYNYLPLYLDEEDYAALENRITEKGLRQAMQKNFQALVSPLGIGAKKMIVKDPLGITGMAMEKLREFQPDENLSLYQNHLFTADKKHLIFFVELTAAANESSKNEELIDQLAALQSHLEKADPSLAFEYFGTAAVSVANAKRIKKDIMVTVSLTVVLLFLVIVFFYRKMSVFFVVIFPGLFGALIALSLLAWLADSVSSIALGVGSVLLGVTVDYALHLFTHFKHQDDIRKLFKDITSPILMSSATTACAFFALLFIRSEALGQLGIFAGISVLVASVFTLTVLPHFLSKGKAMKAPHRENFVEKAIHFIASIPLHKKTWVILLFLAITVFSFFTWKHVSFEKDMMQLNYMPDHLKVYEKNLNEVSGVAAKKIYLVASGQNMQEALHNNKPIVGKLEELKKDSVILAYSYLNSLIPDSATQRNKYEKWTQFWARHDKAAFLENFREAASEKGFKPGTFREFTARIDGAYKPMSREDMNMLMNSIGRQLVIKGEDKVSVINVVKLKTNDKAAIVDEFARMEEARILDKAYVTSKLVQLLSEDFSKLLNISLAFVFIFILICYGRIELAFVTFIPILISWFWTLGLMYIFGLSFNIVNIIICTFIFGLGVDYSIFIMRGLTQKFKTGADNLVSYKKSIFLSAITTFSGIGVLVFAQHPALKSIAALALAGISSSILITFTFEIIIYRFFIQSRKNKGLVPFTFTTLLLTLFAFLYFLVGCLSLFPIMLLLRVPLAGIRRRKYAFHWIMMAFCRSLIYVMANVKKEFVNRHNIDFSKPSVIIANHHSFLDILLLLSINPKVVMVTNKWVYHSPFFGKSVQFAGYILAEDGVVSQTDHVNRLIKEGYSIIIFPEGTRSKTARTGRFHKGAFYLAEQFNLDIQPVLLHGTSFTMPKGDDFYLKNGSLYVEFLPRIKSDDLSWGEDYTTRTKHISKYFREQYRQLRLRREVPAYFKEIILKNYIYKGPVLEWYVKVKFQLERGYKTLHELIPQNARLVDIGCGYGYTSLALAYSGEERSILGIDYDDQKIEVAGNVSALPSNVRFESGDAMTFDYPCADIFLLSDVLHYLTPGEQQALIENLTARLDAGGKIIIREGDSNKKERHQGTVATEKFSTGSGFNKTRNELHFISEEVIKATAGTLGLNTEVLDDARFTSNVMFILSKKGNGKV